MALPTASPGSWLHRTGQPTHFLDAGRTDYELFEEEDEFVLSVELPGFDPEEITVSWDEGILNIGAEHEDDARRQRKTVHRRFRFPKSVDDGITAEYQNGILEVRLPVEGESVTPGQEIEVAG